MYVATQGDDSALGHMAWWASAAVGIVLVILVGVLVWRIVQDRREDRKDSEYAERVAESRYGGRHRED